MKLILLKESYLMSWRSIWLMETKSSLTKKLSSKEWILNNLLLMTFLLLMFLSAPEKERLKKLILDALSTREL